MSKIAGELQNHVRGLRRYAMTLTGDPSDADELVQETLRRALTYADGGSRIRDLRAYLFTILHNVRVNNVTRSNKAGHFVSLSDSALQVASPPSQEAHVQCRELGEALYRLSDEQREVILLVALEGLSYQGAADVLGVPVGTVMSRLNRGRQALRSMLGETQEHARSARSRSPKRQRIAGQPLLANPAP